MDFPSIPNKLNAIIFNIRTKRDIKGFSQLYVATKLKMSQNAYSKIELGRTKLTVSTLLEIAEILNMQVIELINTVNESSRQ